MTKSGGKKTTTILIISYCDKQSMQTDKDANSWSHHVDILTGTQKELPKKLCIQSLKKVKILIHIDSRRSVQEFFLLLEKYPRSYLPKSN